MRGTTGAAMEREEHKRQNEGGAECGGHTQKRKAKKNRAADS